MTDHRLVPEILKKTLIALNAGYMLFQKKIPAKEVKKSKVVFASDITAETGRVRFSKFSGQYFESIFPEPAASEIAGKIKSMQKTGQSGQTAVISFNTENGGQEYFRVIFVPINDLDFALIFQDVGAHRNLDNQISTNFQRLEKRVQQLKKEKRALNEKMNTIELEKAKAVHDLKTPLTSIFGFGVLLKNELDSEEVDEKNLSRYSEKILKNTQRLEMLINEVLENEDDADGQIEVISIKDCIDEIRNELSFRISKKNILLNLCELPEIRIIKMDLLKILRNIISNSVKYNDPDKDGEIRIYHERPDNSRLHYIIIEDNGIGICQENIDTVLQPYNREERCDIKGSGIGLSICREVMEKYCGELGIKSRAGSGTAVKLGFPSELFVTV